MDVTMDFARRVLFIPGIDPDAVYWDRRLKSQLWGRLLNRRAHRLAVCPARRRGICFRRSSALGVPSLDGLGAWSRGFSTRMYKFDRPGGDARQRFGGGRIERIFRLRAG